MKSRTSELRCLKIDALLTLDRIVVDESVCASGVWSQGRVTFFARKCSKVDACSWSSSLEHKKKNERKVFFLCRAIHRARFEERKLNEKTCPHPTEKRITNNCIIEFFWILIIIIRWNESSFHHLFSMRFRQRAPFHKMQYYFTVIEWKDACGRIQNSQFVSASKKFGKSPRVTPGSDDPKWPHLVICPYSSTNWFNLDTLIFVSVRWNYLFIYWFVDRFGFHEYFKSKYFTNYSNRV